MEIRYEPERINDVANPLPIYEGPKKIGEARVVRFHDNSHASRRFKSNATADNRQKYVATGYPLEETGEYCKSRMRIAGCGSEVFTEGAIAAIHTSSGGFMRLVNKIASASLMYCTQKKTDIVDDEAVYQGNLEIEF